MSRTWFPILALVVATAVPAVVADAPPPRRLIVMVDASASMATRTGDGAHRFGAVRDALQALAAMMDPEAGDLSLELWAFGARTDLTDTEACSDVAPLAGIPDMDHVEPRGAAPLSMALETLAETAGPFTEHDLVVLIADGLDSCGGHPRAAADAFRTTDGDQRLRILGVSSHTDATATFLDMGPTRRPASSAELLRDLLLMTEAFAGLKTAPQPITLDITGGGGNLTTATFTGGSLIEPVIVPLGSTDAGRTVAEAPPGPYTVSIDRGEDSPVTLFRVRHRRHGRITVNLPEGVQPAIEADLVEDDGMNPPRMSVSWNGAGNEPMAIRIFPSRASGGSWLSSTQITSTEGRLELPLPEQFGPTAVHLVALREDHDLILASVEVAIPGRLVELEVDETLDPGFPLAVSWSGTVDREALITVVPEGAEDETIGPWRHADHPPPIDLEPPEGGCSIEVRILSAQSRRVVARSVVEPLASRANLLVPAEVTAADTFVVHWWGPNHADDIVTLTHADGAPASYLAWRNATDSSPVEFQAPPAGGTYEIRYLSGGTDVLATHPVAVVEPNVTLEVQPEATVGSRIQVTWTGPTSGRSLIAIAPAGSPPSRMFDFVSADVGSSASLSAPFDPGAWVVRYLDTDPLQVVTEVPIRIVP